MILRLKQLLIACALVMLWVAQVHAHNRSESFSQWSWQGAQLSYRYSVLQREATRIPAAGRSHSQLAPLLAAHLEAQLSVFLKRADASLQACSKARVVALAAADGFLQLEGQFDCDPEALANSSVVIVNNSFFDLISTHTHYARIRRAEKVQEIVFTSGLRKHLLSHNAPPKEQNLNRYQAFTQYLWIGAEHILQGWDHLAFLLGLLLLASGWRQLIYLITGFTLGHSISLACAVLGVAQPNSLMVEALIGFTIALVVLESAINRNKASLDLKSGANMTKANGDNYYLTAFLPLLCAALAIALFLLSRPGGLVFGVLGVGVFSASYLILGARLTQAQQLRLCVTALFGVIHGFGFAGGLLEIGFSAEHMAFVLLGFNVGVELGQLSLILFVSFLLYITRRQLSSKVLGLGSSTVSAMLAGLGVFWFASRLLA